MSDKARSITNLTPSCAQTMCCQHPEITCRHCAQQYCYLCFMSHRTHIIDDMTSIHSQMVKNRKQGVDDIVKFIDKQAQDAKEQAKQLVDDAINRILNASKNIYQYIDNRRQTKLSRLNECLDKFDNDKNLLQEKLDGNIFLTADVIMDLRKKYAYNMFDHVGKINEKSNVTEQQTKNEIFFSNYRFYDELINLRQKWTFLQAALTTVYFPSKKDISLDKILTFLEYRHDRVLENYREHLALKEETKALSLKTGDELLNQLSFLKLATSIQILRSRREEVRTEKKLNVKESYNFYYTIDECDVIPALSDKKDYSHSSTTPLTKNEEKSNGATTPDNKNEEIITAIKIIKTPSIPLTKNEDEKREDVLIPSASANNIVNDDTSSQDSENSWQSVNRYDYEDLHEEQDSKNAKKLEECDKRYQKLVETLRKVEKQFDIKPVI
ncbi:unnamed protein product [Didymodactylos carnosus]|uniref:Uncharacterized protein n=1 Tax=Didymodactylos carnosus TaxID=1234261 RepID=A0A815AU01_9BILA|nr:unnamed protein product [Didymodactylos carnosus]CAF1260733.1 unnamed protein product [Didymodactylos carnosus]CAF3845376.1 unnamed protein product [Didymodactylos carnosus]CAF4038017.1 unnamed protein product [Didymodactylos carnosus]